MVREVLRCRQLDVTRLPGRHAAPRKEVVYKAMDLVDQHADEYLFVEDLATAAGVSERTLQTAFQEYFSVGPLRYLQLRSLHQVRRAPKAADPSMTTVAEIVPNLVFGSSAALPMTIACSLANSRPRRYTPALLTSSSEGIPG
jgi:AraC-like DNA-binding protein